MRLYKLNFLLVFFINIIISVNLFSKDIDSTNTKPFKELLENLISVDSSKIKNNFQFPINDKILLETLKYHKNENIETLTTQMFIKNYYLFFPEKYLKLFVKIINEKRLESENIFNILIAEPSEDEKECKIQVHFQKINDTNIALSFGTIYNQNNDFNLEDDYFCDEFTYIFIFELINDKLIFKEFNIAG